MRFPAKMYHAADKIIVKIAFFNATIIFQRPKPKDASLFLYGLSSFVLYDGALAQMVERSLSVREIPGSIPGFSKFFFLFFFWFIASNYFKAVPATLN